MIYVGIHQYVQDQRDVYVQLPLASGTICTAFTRQDMPYDTVIVPVNLMSLELAPTLTANEPEGTTQFCLATSQ